jgi:hypothetical protein
MVDKYTLMQALFKLGYSLRQTSEILGAVKEVESKVPEDYNNVSPDFSLLRKTISDRTNPIQGTGDEPV